MLPEPEFEISESSVEACILRLVKSVGLFSIKVKELAFDSLQLDLTLRYEASVIASSLLLRAEVKSSADKPLPASAFCFASKAACNPVILDIPSASKSALFVSM